MAAIHDLISQISDPRLRERLSAEWKAASHGKKFGLVFEDHLPELLPLPKAKPHRGDLVCRRQGALKDVWQVKSVKDGVVTCVKPQDETHPSEPARSTAETVNFAIDEVMVVREFGEEAGLHENVGKFRRARLTSVLRLQESRNRMLAQCDRIRKLPARARPEDS